MAGWIGPISALVETAGRCRRRYVTAAGKIHGDDTSVPVLDPGRGKTKTGRLWVYVRTTDQRQAPIRRRLGIGTHRPGKAPIRRRTWPSSRRAAGRCVCRLQWTVRKRRDSGGRLLGTRQAKVLRSAREQQITHCRRGTRPHPGSIRRRRPGARQTAGPTAGRFALRGVEPPPTATGLFSAAGSASRIDVFLARSCIGQIPEAACQDGQLY